MSSIVPAKDRGYAYPAARLGDAAAVSVDDATRAWAMRRLAREDDGDQLAAMLGLAPQPQAHCGCGNCVHNRGRDGGRCTSCCICRGGAA